MICDRRGRKGADVTYVTVGTVKAVEGRRRQAPTLSDDFNTPTAPTVAAVVVVVEGGVGVGVTVDAGAGAINKKRK